MVELGGRKISSVLCRNPWAGPCADKKCFICTTGGKGQYNPPGCTYEVQCLAYRDKGPDKVPLLEGEREDEGDGRTRVP